MTLCLMSQQADLKIDLLTSLIYIRALCVVTAVTLTRHLFIPLNHVLSLKDFNHGNNSAVLSQKGGNCLTVITTFWL